MNDRRAVLCDMDGTLLIDTRSPGGTLWRRRELRSAAIDFSSHSAGATIPSFPNGLAAAATPERVAQISSAKEELYRGLVRKNGMPALPGVSHWVHRLHEQGWLQAIASAAPRPNIEVVLEALGLPTVVKASCLRKMCTGESPIPKCTWRQHRGWELCPPGASWWKTPPPESKGREPRG